MYIQFWLQQKFTNAKYYKSPTLKRIYRRGFTRPLIEEHAEPFIFV